MMGKKQNMTIYIIIDIIMEKKNLKILWKI